MKQVYEAFDETSFERFCDEAALPAELRVSFRTFARAFFSDEADLSTADVLRAFHFYYLSHDLGLMYDYPAGDYETTLLRPIRADLEANGVDIRLSSPVDGIDPGDRKRFRIAGEEYDWVVIAADIPGMQQILKGSDWLREARPDFVADMQALRTSHGYAVWRIWVDRDVRPGLPTFVNVDRRRVLDSVTLYHRITDEAREWAEAHGGAVLELHSYALSRDVDGEAEVRRLFLEELEYYFPELAGLSISADVLQVRHDFPAFAPGQRALRPEPKLPIEGLLMAGDWVRLPYPMTHMEAAFTSGLLCANAIFDALGLQEEPIFTVAPKGLLRPKRAAPLATELRFHLREVRLYLRPSLVAQLGRSFRGATSSLWRASNRSTLHEERRPYEWIEEGGLQSKKQERHDGHHPDRSSRTRTEIEDGHDQTDRADAYDDQIRSD